MKPFLTLAFALSSLSILAQMHIGTGKVCGTENLKDLPGKTVCLCEVQRKSQSRAAEYPFYKVGCGKWLGAQKCDVRKTIEEHENVDDILNSVGKISHVKIGYVGHWPSSSATQRYVKNRIVPIVEKYDAPVYYDNTACSGANDPILVRDFLMELPENIGSKISVKANENISVGEWDTVLKPLFRSNAEITMCTKGLEVPHCKSFENKGCSIELNYRDTVGCLDKGGKFKVLKCERKREGRVTRLERGKWRNKDISDQGGTVELDKYSMSRVGAFYDVEFLVKKTNGGEEKIGPMPIYINHYKYANLDRSDVREDILREAMWYTEVDEIVSDFKVLKINEEDSFSEPFEVIYSYVPNNKNLNKRRGPQELMEHFRDNFNPIVNYYKMHRSEVEKNSRYVY